MADERRTWTLAFLFRGVTCCALVLGWGELICRYPAWTVFGAVTFTGVALGCVVGWRRRTTVFRRVLLALSYFAGSAFLALYSAVFATAWQWDGSQEPSERILFQAFDPFLDAGTLVFMLPFAIGTLIYLLRAWTWSAHDYVGAALDDGHSIEKGHR